MTPFFWKVIRFSAIAGMLSFCTQLGGAVEREESFNIESGPAVDTLVLASEQGRIQLLYAAEIVRGVTTRSVKGRLPVQEALNQMLQGTPLAVVPVSDGNAFGIVNRAELIEDDLKPQNNLKTPESQFEMNIPQTNDKRRQKTLLKTLAAVLTLGIAGGPGGLTGQEDANQEPIFDLSPFTVDASEDTGYSATSTLAGTRIRTDLRDLGSSISVVTSEFLEDTGATDAASLLSYMGSTEVGGAHGNFSGAEASDTGRFVQPGERANPQFNQRIRGLGAADLTRGTFFNRNSLRLL